MDETFLIVFVGLTSTVLGCVCAMAPLQRSSCVSVSLLHRVAGRIKALKPARCLDTVVMWVIKEREMKLLYCL